MTDMARHADDFAADRTLSIGEAAAVLGLSTRALRYYEQVGLVTPCSRTTGGNRLYSESDIARVQRVREMQELLGADLETIRIILTGEDRAAELRAAYHATDEGHADRIAVLQEAVALYGRLIEQVDARRDRLEAFRDQLDAKRRRARAALRRESRVADPPAQGAGGGRAAEPQG